MTASPPTGDLRTILNRTAAEAEDRIVRENRQLRQESRSGFLLVVILLRKLGGEAVITDEELVNAEHGTLVEYPEADGRRLLAIRSPEDNHHDR